MLADRYDLPLSTASSAARGAYVEGSDLTLTLFDRATGLPAREASHIAYFDLVFAGRSNAGVAPCTRIWRSGPATRWCSPAPPTRMA